MSQPIIICDDSRMARKQLARALPDDWEVEVHFAEDGRDLLSKISEIEPILIFLDLNMPELDGYETLEEMNEQELDYDVIVVSGDIQPEAQARVSALGAIDFIKKPASAELILDVLDKHAIFSSKTLQPKEALSYNDLSNYTHFLDACQEVSNIAMGRAGDALARFLDVFVKLPVPRVNDIEISELKMALQFVGGREYVSAVCQGFIGPGVRGEALLIFTDSSFRDMAKLMRHKGKIDQQVELELLMDVSNVIVGACLSSFAQQLDLNINQAHPVVLGQHMRIDELFSEQSPKWRKALTIEITFGLENANVNCDLLMLFTEDCIETLRERISYIV